MSHFVRFNVLLRPGSVACLRSPSYAVIAAAAALNIVSYLILLAFLFLATYEELLSRTKYRIDSLPELEQRKKHSESLLSILL